MSPQGKQPEQVQVSHSVVSATLMNSQLHGLPTQLSTISGFIAGMRTLMASDAIREIEGHISDVLESLSDGQDRYEALTVQDIIAINLFTKELNAASATLLHISKRLNREFLSKITPGYPIGAVTDETVAKYVPILRDQIEV